MKKINFLFFFMVLTLLISLHASPAFSGFATLTWDTPVTNADGTPLTDLAGFKIYYGISSRNYLQSIDVGNVTTYTVNNLTEGVTYYFATTAYDSAGNESTLSNEVMKVSEPGQYYTLTVSKNGSGTVTGQGINCGADCAEAFTAGHTITLTATAATGYSFTGWSDGACSGTGTCIVTMNAAKTVTATFTLQTYTISSAAGPGGNISPSGSVSVNYGASKTFIISAITGYHLVDVQIDGNSIGAATSYTFSNVAANHSINAAFESDNLPPDIIIDNGDPGTSSTGIWQVSKSSKYNYGKNSLWARNGATYAWQMNSEPVGIYEVYMWWSAYKNRPSKTAVDIKHGNGTSRVYVNQQENAGTWNSLGQYYFDPNGSVTISAAYGSTVNTCADAVWFRPLGMPTVTIIDNRDAITSRTGTWSISDGINPYGSDSLYSRNGSTFTWHFTPAESGNYELSMWWTYRDTRSTSVPIDIEYSGGTDRVVVDQREDSSTWNILGTYPFEAGRSYRVTITAQPIPTSSSTTCADAVRFTYVQ